MNSYSAVALGQAGCVVIATTGTLISAPTGRFWEVVQVISNAKFHTLTNTIRSGDQLANTTSGSATEIGAGICLYGNFTEIRLHSGVVVAYFGI
jgi:hypothetical protein